MKCDKEKYFNKWEAFKTLDLFNFDETKELIKNLELYEDNLCHHDHGA